MTASDTATSKTDVDSDSGAKREGDASAASGDPTRRVRSAPEELDSIPGLEVVGRGIYLRPRQPYQLKDILVDRNNERPVYCSDTGHRFSVPQGYEVNDSPPMPADQTVNQTIIEETWESFESHLELDAKLAAGSGPFSVKANATQTRQLRSSEKAFYALRTSFIPLWTVYLPTLPDMTVQAEMIPTEFTPEKRAEFERFFQRYGTHFVRTAWVGGTASLAFTIVASANTDTKDIQAGINASYGAFSAEGKVTEKDSRASLLENSRCSVWGKGGNESLLATLNSLDQARYNKWLSSIKANPQAIELEVVGIWNLVGDQRRANALRDAYRAAYEFKPITAVFAFPLGFDYLVYFIRGNEFFLYAKGAGTSSSDQFDLHTIGFLWIDAAFAGLLLPSAGDDTEFLSNTVFWFCRDQYVRMRDNTICADVRLDGSTRPAGPTSIAEGWPGVPFDRIDAVLNAGPESIYFFKGDEYIRFNWLKNKAEGVPKSIRERWAGVTFDRIDAAIYLMNGKAYFFRGDQYIVYDMVTYRADPGYPKFLPGSYIEDWNIFD